MLLINNRDKLEWYEGITVQDVLDKMGYSYVLITVTVNDELVDSDDYDSHKIDDNAQITIFHLAHGG